MNKSARMLIAIILIFGITIMSSPHQVQAKKVDTTPISAGSWSAGSTFDISIQAASAPTWLQLLSNEGVQMTSSGKICHPLRGGQFGWIGQIMQYKDGQWVKVTTVNDWFPNKEGEFMACAEAPAAGTYALFGYWQKPEGYEPPSGFDCDSLVWNVSVEITLFTGSVSGVPAGTQIDIAMDPSSTPLGISIASTSSTTTNDADGNFILETSYSTGPKLIRMIFTLPQYGCSYTKDFSYIKKNM